MKTTEAKTTSSVNRPQHTQQAASPFFQKSTMKDKQFLCYNHPETF